MRQEIDIDLLFNEVCVILCVREIVIMLNSGVVNQHIQVRIFLCKALDQALLILIIRDADLYLRASHRHAGRT